MPITEAQYRLIQRWLPVQRGNVSVSNLRVLNAILYVAEHDCRWRNLPKRFGNWHTVYTRMNRWSRNGVLDRVFVKLQQAGIVRIIIDVSAAESAVDKMLPDRARAAPEGPGPAANGAQSRLIWLPRLLTRA
jgi:transposase